MIARGMVNTQLEAIVRLRDRGPSGSEIELDAVIDTGYTGVMTLPATTVDTLGLIRQSGGQALLADGSSRRFDVFAAELEWGGRWRSIEVSALGTEVLVGMRLLAGHELRIGVVASGIVEVTELS